MVTFTYNLLLFYQLKIAVMPKRNLKRSRSTPSSSSNDDTDSSESTSSDPSPDSESHYSSGSDSGNDSVSGNQDQTIKSPKRISKSSTYTSSKMWNYGHIPTLRPEECSTRTNNFNQARRALHLSSQPTYLPCRDTEYNHLFDFLAEALNTKLGQCLYISGVPGTGKTATFYSVLRSLRHEVELGKLDAFNFVDVNGGRLLDPTHAYRNLYAGLNNGKRVPSERAKDTLTQDYQTPSFERMTLVLLDELDHLVHQNQTVVYDFTNWAHSKKSKLIVVAIANTMDLPERLLNKKVASRLGRHRLKFQPYIAQQLTSILNSRLGINDTPHPFIKRDATQLAGLRVAGVNGDARQVLELMRLVVDIAQRENDDDSSSDDDNNVMKNRKMPRVQVNSDHVQRAYKELHSSPMTNFLLNGASTLQKLILGIMLLQQKRSGLNTMSELEIQQYANEIVSMSCTSVTSEHKTSTTTRRTKNQSTLQTQLQSNGLENGFPHRGAYVIPRVLRQLQDMRFILYDGKQMYLNISEQDLFYALKEDELMRSLLSIHHLF